MRSRHTPQLAVDAMTTLITLTSDRPEAFALCERWMASQTWTDYDRWVVVDDGQIAAKTTMKQIHIRRRHDSDGLSSFLGNLRCALEVAGDSEIIVFIEDDVWYQKNYLRFVLRGLNVAVASGEARCREYNVRTRAHFTSRNTEHASLCQTAIRGLVVPLLMEVLSTIREPSIDFAFWRELSMAALTTNLRPRTRHSVNIKGMPGKPGLIAHERQLETNDPGMVVLREWCGDDSKAYEKFYRW